MKNIFFSLLVAPALAFAGPFAEVGVGANVGAGCTYRIKMGDCSDSPLGFVAVGYRVPDTGLILQVDHRSSMVERDHGESTVSIRYRWEGKD